MMLYSKTGSLAKLNARHREQMMQVAKKLAPHALVHMSKLSAQDLKVVLAAYASCKIAVDAALRNAMRQQIVSTAGIMSAPDVADLMWAYAKNHMGHEHAIKQTMQDRARDCVADCKAKDVAMMYWASAKLGWTPSKELWARLEDQAVAVVEGFNSQDVSNTLWAYATLGRAPPDELLRRLEARAAAVVEGFTPQEVSNTLWAFACFSDSWSPSFASLLASKLGDSNQWSHLGLFQIHQFLLACDLDVSLMSNHEKDVRHLRQSLGIKARACFSSNDTRESHMQKQVTATLESLSANVQAEAVDARSGYSIDCLVHGWEHHKDVKIAVEVDGPSHFITRGSDGQTKTANGATAMKRRHLGLLGYRVVSVPYWEWDALKGTQAQQSYMQQKLRAAVL